MERLREQTRELLEQFETDCSLSAVRVKWKGYYWSRPLIPMKNAEMIRQQAFDDHTFLMASTMTAMVPHLRGQFSKRLSDVEKRLEGKSEEEQKVIVERIMRFNVETVSVQTYILLQGSVGEDLADYYKGEWMFSEFDEPKPSLWERGPKDDVDF